MDPQSGLAAASRRILKNGGGDGACIGIVTHTSRLCSAFCRKLTRITEKMWTNSTWYTSFLWILHEKCDDVSNKAANLRQMITATLCYRWNWWLYMFQLSRTFHTGGVHIYSLTLAVLNVKTSSQKTSHHEMHKNVHIYLELFRLLLSFVWQYEYLLLSEKEVLLNILKASQYECAGGGACRSLLAQQQEPHASCRWELITLEPRTLTSEVKSAERSYGEVGGNRRGDLSKCFLSQVTNRQC